MSNPAPPGLLPLFAELRGRRVPVVGDGVLARRKVESLLAARADGVVGAPVLEPALAAWKAEARIEHRAGSFEPHWLDDAWPAIAVTDDAATHRAVVDAADAHRVCWNAVDDAGSSRFHAPTRVERDPLQIAISSGGGAPMLARLAREQLETQSDESFAALAWPTCPRLRVRTGYAPALVVVGGVAA